MSENYLIHFGNKNSGRYPRGSGERPHQHDGLMLSKYKNKKRRIINDTIGYTNDYIKRELHNEKNVKNSKSLNDKINKLTDADDEVRGQKLSSKEKQKIVNKLSKENKAYVNAMLKAKPMYTQALKDIDNAKSKREVKRIFKTLKYRRPWRATVAENIIDWGLYTNRGQKKYGSK